MRVGSSQAGAGWHEHYLVEREHLLDAEEGLAAQPERVHERGKPYGVAGEHDLGAGDAPA